MKTLTDDPVTGFAFHCHHNKLIDWAYDYQERVEWIRMIKPLEEQELRLRLFKMIPEDALPKTEDYAACQTTQLAYKEARAAYDEANNAYYEADRAYGEALDVYGKALDVYEDARDAYKEVHTAYSKVEKGRNKAFDTYIRSFDLDNLHQRLCPNCPWDGETIFS